MEILFLTNIGDSLGRLFFLYMANLRTIIKHGAVYGAEIEDIAIVDGRIAERAKSITPNEGDIVITSGNLNLADGTEVKLNSNE